MKCAFCNQKIDPKTTKKGKKLAYFEKKTYHSGCLIKKKNGNERNKRLKKATWMTKKTYKMLIGLK